tara:strand:- start:258 stop:806 length:549 start_codon:yes stop_codon:yes gene_type:complete
MNLSVGDQIYVTDERLEGILLSFTEVSVTIECPDGFEYTFPIDKIYKINEEGKVENQPKLISGLKSPVKKDFLSPSNDVQLVFNTKNTTVDLHLEALLPLNYQRYSDLEALELQLDVVIELIWEANRRRIRKFVIVHGVGKGRLRKEIRRLLIDSYPEIEFLDGNYQKYGDGATELIIHQFD